MAQPALPQNKNTRADRRFLTLARGRVAGNRATNPTTYQPANRHIRRAAAAGAPWIEPEKKLDNPRSDADE